jgi:cbb3-type cytochrome oxidase maturation protein
MTAGILLLVFGLIFLSGSALLAIYWAAKSGQFSNLSEGAATIFDEDEPVGKATDRFPVKNSQ